MHEPHAYKYLRRDTDASLIEVMYYTCHVLFSPSVTICVLAHLFGVDELSRLV